MVFVATNKEKYEAVKDQMAAIPAPAPKKSRSAATSLSLLEQLAVTAKKKCKNPKAPILFGKHKEKLHGLVHKTACKQWSCKECAAKNARRAMALCINHINKVGGQWYFATITAHRFWRGKEKSYENIRTNWDKLRKRMIRQHGKNFDYFRVWEYHKDGSFHLHIITNCQLPYAEKTNKKGEKKFTCAWLKDNAAECGLGFMADYQPLDNAGFAAHYVTKYMTKSFEDSDKWISGMRRYQTSHDWTRLPDMMEDEKTDYDWQYMKNSSHFWFEMLSAQDAGFEIYISSNPTDAKDTNWLVNWFASKRKGERHSHKVWYEQSWFKKNGSKEILE